MQVLDWLSLTKTFIPFYTIRYKVNGANCSFWSTMAHQYTQPSETLWAWSTSALIIEEVGGVGGTGYIKCDNPVHSKKVVQSSKFILTQHVFSNAPSVDSPRFICPKTFWKIFFKNILKPHSITDWWNTQPVMFDFCQVWLREKTTASLPPVWWCLFCWWLQ